MNVELPDDTVEFAKVIAGALSGDGAPDGRELHGVLDDLGVLDLAGSQSADSLNAQLNVAVALEEISRAGRRAPLAETIWARAHDFGTTGFVAAAAGAPVDGERIAPYGAFATSVVAGIVDQTAVMPMPAPMRPARIEIDDGHVWLPVDHVGPTLFELDRGSAWRAAAATTVGAMSKAADMAIAHARDRVQFGKPLASFQALQFRLAECHWRLLGLRLLVREAAWRADRGDPLADVVSALAWLYARDVGRIVTKHAHQVHGAIGFTRELGLTTVTGSAAMLRALYPAADAARVVRGGRGWQGSVPPSTVLAGFDA